MPPPSLNKMFTRLTWHQTPDRIPPPNPLNPGANASQQFQHLHPCPSTGRTTGACPGYVRDHIVPLCRGGSDSVTNMQWQTTAEAKDKWECKR